MKGALAGLLALGTARAGSGFGTQKAAVNRVYTDHCLSGTTRARPGLDQALAAVRAGDTLVVPKLDRLAHSVPDARAVADELVRREVRLQIGVSVHDPHDPMGRMFFNILATFAEFEADLIRLRTRECMAQARAKGRLRGKQPELSERQQKELRRMHDTGDSGASPVVPWTRRSAISRIQCARSASSAAKLSKLRPATASRFT